MPVTIQGGGTQESSQRREVIGEYKGGRERRIGVCGYVCRYVGYMYVNVREGVAARFT
jgi:hypothetical protein